MISYIGGKSRIGKWIKDYIPKDMETYVECFSGMYWVFYNLDLETYPNLKEVVYNDFNPLNANLFNCVQNYKQLSKVIDKYPVQVSEYFYEFQKELFDPSFKVDLSKPDFDVASKYVYLLSQVWSGSSPEKAKFIDLKGKYKSKFDTFRDKLKNSKWQSYFDKINVVENMDFQEVIEKYDGDKTFVYADPPYFSTEKYYSNHNFGVETHERLANTLKTMDGKFALSYYDFPQLSEWFPKDEYTWESKLFAKASMAQKGKEQTKGEELLIMNY